MVVRKWIKQNQPNIKYIKNNILGEFHQKKKWI